MTDPISREDVEEALRNAVFAKGEPETKTFADWAERETGTRPKLDFSQFHPFDHSILERSCTEHYGGRRRHAELWWQYRFEYKPSQLWHRWVLCKLFGRHVRTRFKRRPSVDAPWEHGHLCRWCHRRLD